METARFKIFLWDQFIRPIYLLLNIHQLQALLLALLIVNFVVWKSIYAFWILAISLGIIFFFQIYKYYKSGEFIYNYRKYKSERGEYKDYRKLIKTLKNGKKEEPKAVFLNNNKIDMSPHSEEYPETVEELNKKIGEKNNGHKENL